MHFMTQVNRKLLMGLSHNDVKIGFEMLHEVDWLWTNVRPIMSLVSMNFSAFDFIISKVYFNVMFISKN